MSWSLSPSQQLCFKHLIGRSTLTDEIKSSIEEAEKPSINVSASIVKVINNRNIA